MPLTSLPPEARPTTRARCLGSIVLASMTLLAIVPVEAQSRVSAAPTDAPSEASIAPFQTQAPVRAPVHAGSSPLDRAVTLELRDLTLDRALREIDRQANLGLTYTQRVVPLERRVTLTAKGIPAGEALRRVLAGTGVTAELTEAGTVILVRAPQAVPAPAPAAADDTVNVGTVLGVVRGDSGGAPLVGVTVTLTSTVAGGMRAQLQTRVSGLFVFRDVPEGEYLVSARMVGYVPQSRRILLDSSRARVDFVLQKREVQLDEVIVTATGERRRLELGHDITVINAAKVMEERPVTSFVDLLEGRVPGLTVQRTSGAPGDPARIRIRGAGSFQLNNDPIFIVDGIRIYAEQSAARSANLANSARTGTYAAPSPIDNIDPASVERIEVIKGPSASTLYGADAANGVIVVTTKRGRSGPPRWTVNLERGVTELPGRFPEGMARWGHDPLRPDRQILCGPLSPGCVTDSIVTFQALNDPDLTFIDRGHGTKVHLGVDGGSRSFTYRLGGTISDEVGMTRLPQLEVERFTQRTGEAPPDWMQRPNGMKQWKVSSAITSEVGSKATVGLSTSLTRGEQRRSALENRLASLMGMYVDRASNKYYPSPSGVSVAPSASPTLIGQFMERATTGSTSFSTALNLNWLPAAWLNASVDAGVNFGDTDGEILLMRGMADPAALRFNTDTAGRVSVGRGRTLMNTLNARATMNGGLPLGFKARFSAGANYSSKSTADIKIEGLDLPAGSASVAKAAEILSLYEYGEDVTSFGVYVEPALNYGRLWLTSALRMDGGSTYGSNAKLALFPKLSASYEISEEPYFPFGDQVRLALRGAYGQAGRQPGPEDRLRLYSDARTWEGGGLRPGAAIETLGNSELRPERSKELEGGFDAYVLDDRVSISVTIYRKTQADALMDIPVPPSVYGSDSSGAVIIVPRNVGVVRNTGRSLDLGARLLRSDAVTWNMDLGVSQDRSMVLELGPGMTQYNTSEDQRIVAGYPQNGRWTRPIMGYSDRNGDGFISDTEILVGDSLVYVGTSDPDYTAALNTSLSFFRRTLTVSAGLSYRHAETQEGSWGQLGMFSPAYSDPNAPLDAQAAVVGLIYFPRGGRNRSTYWSNQTVSTLRLQSIAVTWAAPRALAARAGTQSLNVSVRGSNLWLHAGGYRGLDPNVNGYATGNRVKDTGVVPTPRRLTLSVDARY